MALPDIRFITAYDTEEQSFPDLGVMVHGVPHGALINPDPPALLHHPTLRNIVVTHGVAPGFATWAGREAGEADLRGNVLDTRFDYVALGHVHLRGNPGTNAWYSGSTERTSWGDQAAQPGYALVSLADRGSMPIVDFVDVPARPMETLSPIDGAERTARDLADMILARAGALGMPHAMVRVELQNTPRPLFRETEAIVRREIGSSAWHIRLTAPGDLLDPLGRDAVSGLAELHPLKLFDDFLRKQTDACIYDAEFAERSGRRKRPPPAKARHDPGRGRDRELQTIRRVALHRFPRAGHGGDHRPEWRRQDDAVRSHRVVPIRTPHHPARQHPAARRRGYDAGQCDVAGPT
jgi:DNA repair exonuclease SbcCD nuclease subunit